MGYTMPTTSYQVHPNAHYNMCGHNELGEDCAKNSLLLLNKLNPDAAYRLSYEEDTTEVSPILIAEDGYKLIKTQVKLFSKQVDGKTVYEAVVFPRIEPISRLVSGLDVRVETAGFTWENYVLRSTDSTKKKVTLVVTFEGKEYKYELSVAYR
jgi:hypothetical protein